MTDLEAEIEKLSAAVSLNRSEAVLVMPWLIPRSRLREQMAQMRQAGVRQSPTGVSW
jgi:hypothetical protein